MDPITFEAASEGLVEAVKSRGVTLMVGAGASMPCGAPSGPALAEEIRQRFPTARISEGASLLDAGTAVCNTPPHGRIELLGFVRERLENLSPSTEYKQLPRWYWRGIFTTNYDDLIEQAYRSPGRRQTLQPIHLPEGTATIPRPDHTYLFYLQGSITQPPNSGGSPALSWGDFTQSIQDRVAVMNLLRAAIMEGGTVVYVGYTFNDFLLDGLLEEASRRIGGRNMPYGYALLPDWPADPRQRFKVTRHNIIPVIGAFEDFAGLVGEVADHGYQRSLPLESAGDSPAAGYRLKLRSGPVELTESEYGVYSEYFHVLDESQLAHKAPAEAAAARRFLKGESEGWLPYVQGWAFQRQRFSDVYDAVLRALSAPKRADERLILVHGPAGLGKTVMARQLAYTVYTQEGIPTLLAKPNWRIHPDVRLVDRFFDDVIAGSQDADQPLVLVVDEAELADRGMPWRFARYLLAQGRNVVIVLFARTNEYFRPLSVPEEAANSFISGASPSIPLPETVSDDEIMNLVQHIDRLRVWSKPKVLNRSFWIDYVRREHDSSFFDTVYAIVEDSQEPLRARVKSEFDNLGPIAARAYRFIAATHQFGLALKLEVLMRAISAEWGVFEAEVIKGDAQDVLISEQATNALNVVFKGRTKLISQIVFDHAVPANDQLALFRDLVAAFSPNDMFAQDELDTLRTLLVQVLGPSGFDSRFAATEVAELFAVATSIVEDDVLEHHYGLVERDAGRYLSARKHLEKALALAALLPDDLTTHRESPQHVENSLAQVIGELAMEALKRGADSEADRLVEEAAEHFTNARIGVFPNAAAYDAHARLLVKRAKRLGLTSAGELALAYADALDVIDEGLSNVNDEDRPRLAELKSEVLKEIGQGVEAVSELSRLAEGASPRDAAAYHLIAAQVILEIGRAKRKDLQRAYSHCVTACDRAPALFAARRMAAELYKRLFPEDVDSLSRMLHEAARCEGASSNFWLQYELAVTAFYLDQHNESARRFATLRRISRGSQLGLGTIEVAGERDRDGKEPYEYAGKVVKRPGTRFVVLCEELTEHGDIWLNHRGERFYTPRVNDEVSFVVGFNYRGLAAQDLKRL